MTHPYRSDSCQIPNTYPQNQPQSQLEALLIGVLSQAPNKLWASLPPPHHHHVLVNLNEFFEDGGVQHHGCPHKLRLIESVSKYLLAITFNGSQSNRPLSLTSLCPPQYNYTSVIWVVIGNIPRRESNLPMMEFSSPSGLHHD